MYVRFFRKSNGKTNQPSKKSGTIAWLQYCSLEYFVVNFLGIAPQGRPARPSDGDLIAPHVGFEFVEGHFDLCSPSAARAVVFPALRVESAASSGAGYFWQSVSVVIKR
jgi:hypothetical protein